MQCPRCSAGNPDGAAFCSSCGNKLVATCPRCAAEVPPGARFCPRCGHSLEAAAPVAPAPSAGLDLARFIPPQLLAKLSAARDGGGMQGERRVVTMLFCDLKGSTAAAETMDPEEWAEIMNGAFERLIAPVYRYEGTLARLMGDAILAFFGAPIAHEDDAERAILAGLDILAEVRPWMRRVRQDWGVDLDVRVGINTGLVVVGAVGSDLRVEYTAMGDAVNLAARMEQTAEPGTIRISEATWKLVNRLFHLDAIGGVEVKGKAEPVRAWKVLGPAERPDNLRGIAGLDAPMVGRATDLARLVEAFDDLRGGTGGIVSVIAEAGLGKSRLVAEWAKVSDRGGVEWVEGRSLSYQTQTPYAPFVGILRRLLKVDPEAGPAVAWQQVLAGVTPLLEGDAEGPAAYLATLLGIELTGEARHRVRYLQPPELREKVFGAVVATIEALATRTPLVLVFEDLHWADPSSLALVQALQGLADRAMLLLVALFRPRPQEPSWQFHVAAERDLPHRYRAIALQPLPEADSVALVGHLLRIDGLPTAVRDQIVRRAEGNPFFVEEVIRTLLDGGLVVRDGDTWRATAEIRSISVPETLQGVLVARLDQLSEPDRRAVQVASVLGREFDFPTLAAVAPEPARLNEALSELQRRGLVREVARLPVRRYRFKHGLTRDAAYETLLMKTRRELHVAVAEYWERVEVDRVPEIATHFLEGRQAQRALPYLVRAGEQAARSFAMPEAIGWFEKALAVLDPPAAPELARRTWEGLFNARKLTFDVPGALAAADGLLALGRDLADVRSTVSGLNKKAFVLGLFTGDLSAGAALLRESEQAATSAADKAGLIECEITQCALNTGAGQFETVEHYMRLMQRQGDEIGSEDASLFGRAHLATVLMYMTRYDESLALARETADLAERAGNQYWLCELQGWAIPLCLLRNGDVAGASDVARRGTDLALRIGASVEIAMGHCVQAQIALLEGRYEDALRLNETFAQYAAACGMPFVTALAQCTLGTTYTEIAGNGLHALAAPRHLAALQIMEHPIGASYGTWLCAEIGFCRLAAGERAGAKALFEQALTAPNAAMHLFKPKALKGLAAVALEDGDLPRAREVADEALAYVHKRQMRHLYADVGDVVVRVAEASGDLATAARVATEMIDTAREMGFRPWLFRGLAHRARLLAAQGDAEGAAACATEARAILADLAGSFTRDDLRAPFVRYAGAQLADG